MEDQKIVELFLEKNESALVNAAAKYGSYLHSIAFNIIGNTEDAQECTNDALLRAWNSIPPQKPKNLKAFLARISRNLAIDRWNYLNAEKRGGGRTAAALEELGECVKGSEDVELDEGCISSVINAYLGSLDPQKRRLFVRRYFYLDSVKELAKSFKLSESNVKTTLFRIREGLRAELEKEGIEL